MKIGVIGTGHMGRALGVRWAQAGHEVLLGSRDPAKAQAVAREAGAQAGDFDAAAAFGDVVLYTVRDVYPTQLLHAPQMLAGKIVIDCNNRDLGPDSRPQDFRFDRPPPVPSLTERLAADVPQARVVKAFSTIPFAVIEIPRAQLAPHRVSVFVCGEDPSAKAAVSGLAEELGFVAVDCGGLAHAPLVDGVADFLRLQIGPLGRGLLATASLHVLPAR